MAVHPGATYNMAVEKTGETITAVREDSLANVLKVSGQSIGRMAEEDPEHFSADVAGTLTLAVAPSPLRALSPLLAETRVAQALMTPIKSLDFLDTTIGDVATSTWKYAEKTTSVLSRYEVVVEGLGANGGNVRIRPKFRKATIEQAFAEAPGTWGGKACPTCGTRVGAGTIERGGVIRRDFDIDHTGKTWADRVKAMPDDISRKAVIDAYQEGVRVQCPDCNQGHLYEPNR
jgi:hypothetical protein